MKIQPTKNLITIDVNAKLVEAQKVMDEKVIRHLPVLHEGHLVGVLSDRDIARATRVEMAKMGAGIVKEDYVPVNYQVKDFMSCPVTSINEEADVKEAIKIIIQEKVSSVAILNEGGELVGILSTDDLLVLFYQQLMTKDSNWYDEFVTSTAGRITGQVTKALSDMGF